MGVFLRFVENGGSVLCQIVRVIFVMFSKFLPLVDLLCTVCVWFVAMFFEDLSKFLALGIFDTSLWVFWAV
jgi:hypothetical protein